MVEDKIRDLILGVTGEAYLGELPSSPQNAIAIMLYNGAGNAEYFAFGTVCTPVVKIVIRNKSYELAQQYIEDIKQVLHRHHDDYFLSIIMQGYPTYLGRDTQKLHEFQIVFNIQVKE